MPLGARQTGVAVGPYTAPRDPSSSAAPSGASALDPGGAAAFSGGALQIVRYDEAVGTGAEGDPTLAAGSIRIVFHPNEGTGALTLIDRIVVQTNSTTPTACAFYKGSVSPANLVEFTGTGDRDLADEVNPIFLPGNTLLIAEWTGASGGAVAQVRYQYRVARLG